MKQKHLALVIPEDLKKEFNERVGSLEYYESLSKSVKKILLAWVVLAKRTETRQKRIIEIAENASRKLKPKQFRQNKNGLQQSIKIIWVKYQSESWCILTKSAKYTFCWFKEN